MNEFFNDIDKFIPNNANIICNILNNKGYDSFFVGGALRDYSISKIKGDKFVAKDWDIATTARNLDLQNIFNKILRVNENGYLVNKKGRTELLIPSIETTAVFLNSNMFEVTPMNYKKDEEVVFTKDIFKDLNSRDFTINAMAYSKFNGSIVDFKNNEQIHINPLEDIEKGLIRCINEPNNIMINNRFVIMRAIYFANKLNFNIEENTLDAIKNNIFEVNYINKGKLSKIFEKIIMLDNIEKLDYIVYVNLFQAMVIEFNDNYTIEFIKLMQDIVIEGDKTTYIDRLKYIYNRFSQKNIFIKLLQEFGVNKDMIYIIEKN